ncbi:MAG TPA: 2-oxo acid dehydrogenase subunit E2 [Acidimicrobiales bacterium]|nr:2-oxo acid dehydrogenase subunit E2 [Acidimicrobiales bacterium]
MPNVTMPQLGETVAEGTVTKWMKQVGEQVVRGEVLFEVSTDKVDTEIPAQHDGVLTQILVPEGTTVDVGTVLAVIGDADGPIAAAPVAAAATGAAPSTASSTPAPRPAARGDDAQLSPVVRRLLSEHHLDAGDVVGTGPKGRITRDDVLAHVAASAPSTPGVEAPLSPVVRRLLREHNLDAASIKGTGSDGRVTRRDVEAAIATQPSAPEGDEVIAFSKIRRLTAEHMVRSKATSAHTLMVKEVDYERIDRLRRAQGAQFKEREGFSLTYLAFNALAALSALREFPHLNASVGEDALIVHHDLNLGIAVDIEGTGLVVPVIRHADTLSLVAMARAIRDMATRARTKRLTIDETTKGTFTITNPGPFGTLITGAIINQPQVAILSTDGVQRKPVVVTGPDGESIAIHSVGMLALNFDHRVIDGAYAARFLARTAEILQTRDWATEL